MKIESYKAATPLIQKIEKVDAMVREGEGTGMRLNISVLYQDGSDTFERMDVSKEEDFIGVGLWNLLRDYQKYLHEKLEKL